MYLIPCRPSLPNLSLTNERKQSQQNSLTYILLVSSTNSVSLQSPGTYNIQLDVRIALTILTEIDLVYGY